MTKIIYSIHGSSVIIEAFVLMAHNVNVDLRKNFRFKLITISISMMRRSFGRFCLRLCFCNQIESDPLAPPASLPPPPPPPPPPDHRHRAQKKRKIDNHTPSMSEIEIECNLKACENITLNQSQPHQNVNMRLDKAIREGKVLV
jgi:hypothetical protein